MQDIEDLHALANERKDKFYIDPATGYKVLPSHVHLKRGKCCGNMCRHCPYGWKRVSAIPEEERLETWRGRVSGKQGEIPHPEECNK